VLELLNFLGCDRVQTLRPEQRPQMDVENRFLRSEYRAEPHECRKKIKAACETLGV
jgi:hypothetical protein